MRKGALLNPRPPLQAVSVEATSVLCEAELVRAGVYAGKVTFLFSFEMSLLSKCIKRTIRVRSLA